ncbi:AraC family transcriptional regulator [Lederbergia wuyishanensis]|uniref:AraC-like DNA-binding protein/quercetin dioxygenase-like cupin family protein n=1 Tax=Lederbergia wuyishanensis TaxID=1347903 RepID=A0ABU0D0A4_9BACI|nr:AraC family transcriptional regulator [Lederbergia wuyishanensis]MCJ8006466.1 AraC family transcriptional regulator [Lederbergia wuyishanensis]MDQ0341842.1 AraC-like DNA-binding protein/quercetin dioxygenase-like cupin family protein [Lederbergia wuyishanensis]
MDTNNEVNVGVLSTLKPKVNFANKMTAKPGQSWGPRTISDCQIIFVESGTATLTLGANSYSINAGECVFYGANSPHKLVSSNSNPFSFMSIHFDWNAESPEPIHPLHGIKDCQLNRKVATYKIKIDEQREINFPHYFVMPNIESLFANIVKEYRYEEPGFTFILRGLVTQLITLIIRNEINGNPSLGERRKIAPALESIRKHPEKNWTIQELADISGYHPTYFTSLFKELIGYSPKQYLINERIKKAKLLLLDAKTVEEVSLKLGYTSIHYFCRNFKSITGLTPTEFKLQSLEL